MFDQYGNPMPGTKMARHNAARQKPADYVKVDQVGTESFFVKRNPKTGVVTKMIFDSKTGDVKVRKSIYTDVVEEENKAIRDHAAGKPAYAKGKHQIAYRIPAIVKDEMIAKIGGDKSSWEYDTREFYRMLDGTSKYGDYSQFKMLRGKMPQMKTEI